MTMIDAFTRLIHPGNALSVAQRTYGSRPAFAAALSGTSDKRSKEYKSALRSVGRWEKGRQPKPATLEKLVGKLQATPRAYAVAAPGGVTFRYEGEFGVSSDKRSRKIRHHFSARELEQIGQGVRAGDPDALWKQYGIIPTSYEPDKVVIE